MLKLDEIIHALTKLSDICVPDNERLQSAISKTYFENTWLTPENYWMAINNWLPLLTIEKLEAFCSNYTYTNVPKNVGIIMAGNIPMVGFHDLLCVLLSGNKAVLKVSSDDKNVIPYLVKEMISIEPKLASRFEIVERLSDIDAVIATGSNNSYRYFEYYFRDIPSLLRKNRKSLAVLSGDESSAELQFLADDVFAYYGLGCRNVSLIFLPVGFDFTKVLDEFMVYKSLANHNKFANNYTYHRALLLMNNASHLDTDFALFQEKRDLNAPLSCIYYTFYLDLDEVTEFIENQKENIQCVVGKNINANYVPLGKSQKPDIESFADDMDTFKFLNSLPTKKQLIP